MKHFIIFLSFAVCLSTNSFSQDVVINEIMTKNGCSIEDEDGDTPDWIELYNTTNSIINLNGYTLSDDLSQPSKWRLPQIFVQPHGFLLVFASGKDRTSGPALHTNFKISSSGEPLLLSNALGNSLDQWAAFGLEMDQSFGRKPDGNSTKVTFYQATPSATNSGQNAVQPLVFSHGSGMYSSPFSLNISCADTVRYTLDGSIPSADSPVFEDDFLVQPSTSHPLSEIPTSPFIFDVPSGENLDGGWQLPSETQENAVVIRARGFKNNQPSSPVSTANYFIRNESFNLPVVSISLDPQSLIDADTGIYIPGNALDISNPAWTGNYFKRGMDWERLAHFKFFSELGEEQFSSDVGLRVSGNATRKTPQKSLRLYARCKYGNSWLDFPFFQTQDVESFKRLTLRSKFGYWWGVNTLFTDDFLHSIIAEASPSLDVQATEPAIVYINGEYWGIQNIRERQDRHYLASHYNIDSDNVDIFEGNLVLTDFGSSAHYADLIEFTLTNDMSLAANYMYVKDNVDIDNHIEYMIHELYFGNADWPRNNVKIWRSNAPKTKYCYFVLDLDAALPEVATDPFSLLLNDPYPPLLFAELIKNEEYRSHFLERFNFHLKNTYLPATLNEKLDQMASKYQPEVEAHINRWGNPASYNDWLQHLEKQRNFFENRPCVMESFLHKYFNNIAVGFNCNQGVDSTDFAISVFPNPVTEKFILNITASSVITAKVDVVDITGKIARTITAQSGWNVVDVSALAAGIYFVRVRTQNTLNTVKLIVAD